MSHRITILNSAIIPLMLLVIIGTLPGTLSAGSSVEDGTMLMFVGQDIELLSIASRREETPARAPAVARVISRDEFLVKGNRTLSQILQGSAGFHMARKEWGHTPYLRGTPDSVMFLYDTVPLGSELSKSLHPIDHELSLAAVKQVEIVRGPSSVLWGPDAFAGVVNVVPLSGRDFQGAEAGLTYGEPGFQKGVYLNLGKNFGMWDGFLSLTARKGEEDNSRANLVSFFDYDGSIPVPPDQRAGNAKPEDSRYLDAYARFNMGKKLSISGRLNNSKNPYTVSNHENNIRWRETRRLPYGYVKIDTNHDLSLKTKIRFSGYFSHMNPEYEIIDKKIRQKENTYYSELLMDRSLFDAKGLLTAGLSYKHKKISNAPIWDSYIPSFFGPDNLSFLPGFSASDFSNKVWSTFAQYSHKIGDFDLMLGLRQDFHQKYQDNLSHSAALVWSPLSHWTFKFLYGTAYRTPFARQLLDEKKPDMEKSESYSLQTTWNPRQNYSLTGTVFYNRLSNHIMEDPYAGLSKSNSQDIYGIEIEWFYRPFSRLDLEANLTMLENRGTDERYSYIEYSFVRPDGTVVDVYKDLKHPFDPGPRIMFDLMATWRLSDRVTLFTHLDYFSTRRLIYARGEEFKKASDVWMLHAGATLSDFFTEGLDLSLKLNNITDNRYRTPGTYSMIRDRGISGELCLRYVF